LGGQTVGASTIVGFKGHNQSSAFEARKYLVEGPGGHVYPGELFDVFHEGVSVLVAARETGKNKNGGASVAPEAH
jgi:hypothetical protein